MFKERFEDEKVCSMRDPGTGDPAQEPPGDEEGGG